MQAVRDWPREQWDPTPGSTSSSSSVSSAATGPPHESAPSSSLLSPAPSLQDKVLTKLATPLDLDAIRRQQQVTKPHMTPRERQAKLGAQLKAQVGRLLPRPAVVVVSRLAAPAAKPSAPPSDARTLTSTATAKPRQQKEQARLAREQEQQDKARHAREQEQKDKARLAREQEQKDQEARLAREQEQKDQEARLAREQEQKDQEARRAQEDERKDQARRAREQEERRTQQEAQRTAEQEDQARRAQQAQEEQAQRTPEQEEESRRAQQAHEEQAPRMANTVHLLVDYGKQRIRSLLPVVLRFLQAKSCISTQRGFTWTPPSKPGQAIRIELHTPVLDNEAYLQSAGSPQRDSQWARLWEGTISEAAATKQADELFDALPGTVTLADKEDLVGRLRAIAPRR